MLVPIASLLTLDEANSSPLRVQHDATVQIYGTLTLGTDDSPSKNVFETCAKGFFCSIMPLYVRHMYLDHAHSTPCMP
jgi:hypothetical protein